MTTDSKTTAHEAASPRDLCRQAREYWGQGQPKVAIDAAWAAFDLAPDRRATTSLLAELLRHCPDCLEGSRRSDYLRLLTDRNVEPDRVGTAGWRLVLRSHSNAETAGDADLETLARAFEVDKLVLTLLKESPVCLAAAERFLTRLRRWLLLSGGWRHHPHLAGALRAQASLNGGAWPFDAAERAAFAGDAAAMRTAYLPDRSAKAGAAVHADPVTRAVAAQYEGWPYPAWTRITVDEPRQLPDVVAKRDAELARALPVEADMLIAGCGTGRQAASVALSYPDARVTAIDVSEASLDYARRRCAEFGIGNVQFLKLDLHDVASLGRRFHAIHTAGVLHHLPDPERGLKLLAETLHPGGVMHIMVYNRYQRLMVSGARQFLIRDLVGLPIDDDLLREVRRRFLEQPGHPAAAYVIGSRDFATLAGTHDLLLHRHEDAFDADRLERALDQAGLRMLSIDMPTPLSAARYKAVAQGDPKCRDLKSWERFVTGNPSLGQPHYRFWCYRKPDLERPPGSAIRP